GDRVIADMADREERLDVELVDRIDFHQRGISWSAGLAGGSRSAGRAGPYRRCRHDIPLLLSDQLRTTAPVLTRTRRSHHIHHAGHEAQQQEYDKSERR